MHQKPTLMNLPKPIPPTLPLLEDKELMSDDMIFYIVVGVIVLGILYYVMKDNDSNINEVIEEKKDKFLFPNLDNIDPIKAIELTHKTCPVLGGPTKFSVCVQYPPLNKGFIVSVSCESCVQGIQKSFNTGDGEYTIKEEHDMDILYHNSEPKQVTPLCSSQNMKLVTEKAGTQFMKGTNQ